MNHQLCCTETGACPSPAKPPEPRQGPQATSQTVPAASPLPCAPFLQLDTVIFASLSDPGSVKEEDDHAQRCLSSPQACSAHSSRL